MKPKYQYKGESIELEAHQLKDLKALMRKMLKPGTYEILHIERGIRTTYEVKGEKN